MLALSIPFFSFLANPFFQMAILASMISSIIGGIVGSYVVIKRISFVTGSISHCVLSGLGFSLWLKHLYNLPGLSTLYGAIVSAVFSALIIGWITLKYKQREDSLIAAIWSVGMAIGILFLSLTGWRSGM